MPTDPTVGAIDYWTNRYPAGGGVGVAPGGGGGAPASPLAGSINDPSSPMGLWDLAGNLANQEDARFQEQSDFLSRSFEQTQAALNRGIPTDLLFSQAADQVGARARGSMDRMRASLGARGIDPNSGAASGLLGRLLMQNQNALVGARRDIAIEDSRQRSAAAMQNFANANALAQFRNQSPSMIRADMALNLAEDQLAREGLANADRSNRRSNRTNLLGSIIGGVGGVLGGLI